MKKKKEKSKLGPTRNKIKTKKKQKYGKHTQKYSRQDQNKSIIFFF
jgi:hypothetical protein